MKVSHGVFVVMLSLLVLSACVSVNSVTLYKASTAQDTKSAASGDGVAVLAGNACLHISDRGAEIKTIAAHDYKSPADMVRVAIWIVPERGAVGYSFVPLEMSLTFNDGTTSEPKFVQVSKFHTQWETEKTLIFTPNEYEKIADANHEPPKQLGKTDAPVELWDLTRFVVGFPKPSERASPSQLAIQGLRKDGQRIDVPSITFTLTKESRAVFPGRWADGTSVWDTPEKACRVLQQ
jgi:hypothetical protein